MKKLLALILVLAMVVVAFGCAAKPAVQEETKPAESKPAESKPADTNADAPAEEEATVFDVCLILPMSDAYANTGITMHAGILTAYDYFLEEVGGFQSKNVDINFILCDLENNADLAASLFEKNVDVMDAGIGCFKTAATIACGALAAKYEIPFLNPLSTADTACALETDYVFKMCCTDTQSQFGIAESFQFLESLDDHEYSAMSVIYASDDYGKSLSTAMEKIICPQLGWELLANEQLQVGQTTDASGAISKAKASGSDVTSVVLSANEAVIVQKQFREYKFDQPVWSGGSGYFDIGYFENTAGAGDYVVSGCSWEKCMMELGDPAAFEWYDKISERAGIPFSEAGACAWLAMGVLLTGIEMADTATPKDVAKAINEMELPKEHWANMFNLYSKISFGDMDGIVGVPKLYNINEGASCFFVQSQESEWKLVYMPGQTIENNPIIWPHVPYSEGNTFKG